MVTFSSHSTTYSLPDSIETALVQDTVTVLSPSIAWCPWCYANPLLSLAFPDSCIGHCCHYRRDMMHTTHMQAFGLYIELLPSRPCTKDTLCTQIVLYFSNIYWVWLHSVYMHYTPCMTVALHQVWIFANVTISWMVCVTAMWVVCRGQNSGMHGWWTCIKSRCALHTVLSNIHMVGCIDRHSIGVLFEGETKRWHKQHKAWKHNIQLAEMYSHVLLCVSVPRQCYAPQAHTQLLCCSNFIKPWNLIPSQ